MFEEKFKGSLEKLDAFEKEWNNFKSNQVTIGANEEYTNIFPQSIESKLHSSFDAGN